VIDLLATRIDESALLTTLVAFALILVLSRLKVPLWISILLGAAAMGVGFGLSPREISRTVAMGVIQPRTIGLVFITLCLLGLSATMQAGGQMKQIVSLAQALLRRPVVTMAALPALIGLLPMPGGALFSAPMVESAAGKTSVPGGTLSAVNYWFRHIWEHWWPLYPGVILAISLTERDPMEFMAFQLPMGLAMAAAGLLIFRKIHPELHATAPSASKATKRKLLATTSSIWLILLVWGTAKVIVIVAVRWLEHFQPIDVSPAMAETIHKVLHSYFPLGLGLLASLLWTTYRNRLDRKALAGVWLQKRIWGTCVLVISVMVFQYTLCSVGGAGKIRDELTARNVPLELVIVILPFIAGMVTGLAIGFVGTSFPIVLGLLAGGEYGSIMPYIVLAYAFGHLGMMLSPLHLCHVLSNRFFATSFPSVYRRIVTPAVLTALLAVGYFALLKWLMN